MPGIIQQKLYILRYNKMNTNENIMNNQNDYNHHREYIMLITACKKRHVAIIEGIMKSNVYVPKKLVDKLVNDARAKNHNDVVYSLLQANNFF